MTTFLGSAAATVVLLGVYLTGRAYEGAVRYLAWRWYLMLRARLLRTARPEGTVPVSSDPGTVPPVGTRTNLPAIARPRHALGTQPRRQPDTRVDLPVVPRFYEAWERDGRRLP